MQENYAVEVDHVTVRFNLANQKVDDLKEYFIKLVKKELLFQEFFALQDVSLHIKRGESWGIVGTNGSGKSTLLKVICGIFKPYKGTVHVNGSVAPLIELGAGFDNSMTGRENIFLNGAVLGHSKKYMEENFNAIAEFAQIDKFLDTPVKNYSSGMRARLGFSIATAIQPDILIVDEVLSVGDAGFRKKCEQKMTDMLSGGTTLLYVSHNTSSVTKLCKNAIWLQEGKVMMSGSSESVCKEYLKHNNV